MITFSIGGIALGSGSAKNSMSPLDLVPGAMDIEEPMVVNIARLLQSLDINERADLIELPSGLSDVVLSDCNGLLVARSGYLVISSDELNSDVIFDFSDTTCQNPNVTTTVDGVLVNFTFE